MVEKNHASSSNDKTMTSDSDGNMSKFSQKVA